MQPGNIIQLNPAPASGSARYLLGESRTIALKYLPALLQRMLDSADDLLFELADKAGNHQEQQLYFDAMRDLRLARTDLENRFREHLAQAFENFTRPPGNSTTATEAPLDAEQMRLVDERHLEESLAISGMTDKAIGYYSRQLHAIEQRFLAIAPAPGAGQIPVMPAALCSAFSEALDPVDSEIAIKLIIYKLFDRHVLAHLGPLYDELNVLFIAAGVLPKLKMQINKKSDNPSSSRRHQAAADEIAWLDDSAVSPTQTSLDEGAGYRKVTGGSALETLRGLLQPGSSGLARAPGQAATGGNGIPAELIHALSQLQRLAPDTSGESVRGELDNLKQSGTLSAADRDIIDIVDMLFDFILDDDHLPASARALLARLQIPMIKVALVEPAFFGSKQHPAKKLLNLMARAALGLAGDSNRDNCPVIGHIDAIVSRICAEFSDDISLFGALLQEFEQFLEQQSQQERESQAASHDRLHEREQHALSRAWVTDVIAAAIHGRRLPRVVFELVDGPWKEVMIHTYLNEGHHSPHWKENLRFIDLLIWSAQPEAGKTDRQRLGRIIPQIVRTLRTELEQIDYPPARVDELLAQLEALHLAALRGVGDLPSSSIRVKAGPPGQGRDPDSSAAINRELDAMRRSLADLADADEMLEELFSGINPDSPQARQSQQQISAEEAFDGEVEEIVMSSAFINEKTIPEVDDYHWATVLQLQPGQWITLSDSTGKQQKIKLAWKSDMLGECTFTNWKFKIVADLNFNQLAAKFRAGQAGLIENLPIFERAVDAVINTLQRRTAN